MSHFSFQKINTFSQALHLNRGLSENAFSDKRCNELEVWLKEKGYSDKLVRGQILQARKFSRSQVFNKGKHVENKSLSVFSKLKNVLAEMHLLLRPDREDGKVFE